MKLIERDFYLTKLKNVMGTPDIKVITGMRRVGKSRLMDSFIEYLEKTQTNINIVRIKLTLKEFEHLKIADNLYNYVEDKFAKSKRNFLFIDEIQLCDNFENVINSIYEEDKFDIYLTGSNAFLLSSDLATLFGGRTFEIQVYPFSFVEYLKYYQYEDINIAFTKYLVEGGLAGSYLYNTEEDKKKYLKSLVTSTVAKDIVKKFKLENEDLLNMICDFLMDNVGNKTSVRKIANSLTSNSYKTNDKTVGTYINCLTKSFLFYPVGRYDIKGKKYLESDKKYYLSDTSLRYAMLGNKNMDYGHLYENIVALELKRREYEIYVGSLGDREVDFVVLKDGLKTYIQVSDDITNENVFNREVKPLLDIRDAYPKIILANTKHETSYYEGIKIIDIASWLNNTSQF